MANLAFNLKPQVIASSTLITILWVDLIFIVSVARFGEITPFWGNFDCGRGKNISAGEIPQNSSLLGEVFGKLQINPSFLKILTQPLNLISVLVVLTGSIANRVLLSYLYNQIVKAGVIKLICK